jgi:hypothetical protein
MMREGVL